MKPEYKTKTGTRVARDETSKSVQQVVAGNSWDEIVQGIDQRANYIGPVLDHLLKMGEDLPKWVMHE